MQTHLGTIERKLGDFVSRLSTTDGQIAGLGGAVGAVRTGLSDIHVTLGSNEGRLTRIERRLDRVGRPAQ